MLAFINIDWTGARLMELSGVVIQQRLFSNDFRVKGYFSGHPAAHGSVVEMV